MRYQFGSHTSSMKFGKNTNESTPHAGWRAGLSAGGSSSRPMSGLSHGPNRPLRSTLLDRLHHARILRRRHAAPRRHHAVRAVELVGERLEAVALQLARLLVHRLLRVQNRCVVELGEGVDEELPVAPDLGPVLVDLGHLAERVALEAGAELAEVVGAPTRCSRGRGSRR